MKGVAMMYDHKWKVWGVIISAIGLIAMVTERLMPFVIFKKFTAAQHYSIFEWIMLLGLIGIMYCKEKYDDERARAIRLRAFQISFAMMQAVLLGMALTGSISLKAGEEFEPSILFVFSAMGIILYLLVFYVGLYFDFLWEYEDKEAGWENIKNMGKNKWGILAYLAITIVLLALLTLFE
jgi:branched-subunit amino acid transport protein AzlD